MIPDLLAHHAASRPDRLAVTGAGTAFTYGALDRLANKAARALTDLGLRPGDRVAFLSAPSGRLAALSLGALRLGATLLPLAPEADPGTNRDALIAYGPRVLVSGEAGRALLEDELSHLAFFALDEATDAVSWGDLDLYDGTPVDDVLVSPSAVAALVPLPTFAGQAPGLCVTQRRWLAQAAWLAARLDVGPEERISALCAPHSPLAQLDLHLALQAGATAVVSPAPEADAAAHRAFLREAGIGIWIVETPRLARILDEGGIAAGNLRAVVVGGEPLAARYHAWLAEHLPGVQVLNLHGSLETGLCAVYAPPEGDGGRLPALVETACGARIWAVSLSGAAARPGDRGEMVVQGPTVLAGQWRLPPRGDRPYFTGDLVAPRPDGGLDLLGRRAVSLGEGALDASAVEAVLAGHPDLREAAAIVAGTGPRARVFAFVVASTAGDAPDPDVLRLYCADRLPGVLVPAAFQVLEALPRTTAGRLDRPRLFQALDPAAPPPRPGGDVLPRSIAV